MITRRPATAGRRRVGRASQRHPIPSVSRRTDRVAIPGAFCGKSLDLLDCKGVGIFGRDKEFVRISEERS